MASHCRLHLLQTEYGWVPVSPAPAFDRPVGEVLTIRCRIVLGSPSGKTPTSGMAGEPIPDGKIYRI